MAAPKGNNFAKGNKGGRPYTKSNRERAQAVGKFVLDEAYRIMTEGTQAQKYELVMKHLGRFIPTELDVKGDGPGGIISIQYVKPNADAETKSDAETRPSV